MNTRIRNNRIGLTVIIVLCLIPVVLWFFMKPLDMRFGSFVMVMTSIGQLSALVGTAMFSLSLILIARFKWFESHFGGLDRVFKMHAQLGMIGFMLILVHPLVLAARYVPVSVTSAATFFVPSLADVPRTLGIAGLLIMMLLLGITLFAVWRYQRLLFAHKLLGIGFMLGALHGFLIPSDISNNIVLALYMGALALGGTAAYLYRTMFKRLIPTYMYRVAQVRMLDHTVVEIIMQPLGDQMYFTPGQFIFVSFKDANVSKEVHPFSISSRKDDPNLGITIKALGDYTTALPALAVGAEATIEGPYGGFTGDQACTSSEVWVAGGIGVTPFMSRARSLPFDPNGPSRVDFYYAANTLEEMIFLRELQMLAQQRPGLTIIPHASKESGFLSAGTLLEHSGSLADKDIFICGPPVMMKSIIRQCKECGVSPRQIHAEEFSML